MKHPFIASITFAIGMAAYAEGRHDDKLHGMSKSAVVASEDKGAAG